MKKDKQQFAKQLGQNIAKYRQALGFTQEQLAEKLEMGNEAVSRIERGVAMPSIMRLFEFADILHCDVADLLVTQGDMPSEKWRQLIALTESLPPEDQALVTEMLRKLTLHLKAKNE